MALFGIEKVGCHWGLMALKGLIATTSVVVSGIIQDMLTW